MRVLSWVLLCLTLAVTAAHGGDESPVRSETPAGRHWAYQPLRRPAVPETRNRTWARHPLDRFLLAQLETAHAAPAPPLPPAALARRLALSLTHLPLDLETLDEFLADERPDAVERLVDRLLASPQYGPRMAQPWLDLARYADTHGYHADSHRDMWRWRDWVVAAFNRGQPYDEFLTEQLAGDLLPGATLEQRLATGFLRNHMIIFENGVVDEEYRVEYVADRVATVATVALGQTLACARCHDHKHDPFTQRDYYALFALFNNVPERGVDGERGNAVPYVAAPTQWQQEALRAVDARLAASEAELARALMRDDPRQAAWEQSARNTRLAPPTDAWLRLTLDEPPGEPPRNAAGDAVTLDVVGSPTAFPGWRGSARLCGGEVWFTVTPAAARPALERGWSCGLAVYPTVATSLGIAARFSTSEPRRGWELTLVDRRPTLRVVAPPDQRQWVLEATTPLVLRRWQHLLLVVDLQAPGPLAQLYLDGRLASLRPVPAAEGTAAATEAEAREELRRAAGPLTLGRAAGDEAFRGGLDEIVFFDRPVEPTEAAALAGVDPLVEWLAVPVAQRTPALRTQIRQRFLRERDAAFQAAEAAREQALADRARLQREAPTAMVMEELPQPRPTFVLARGRYDEPRERVAADVPRWLTPAASQPVRQRLELARWLFRDDHPLTARVTANRGWHDLFGWGLVSTPDDFGTHGAAPRHPELLDWLACELRGDPERNQPRWDLKRWQRQLVTSATFRQSRVRPRATAPTSDISVSDADTRDADTRDARQLGHGSGPQYRLPAEALRDQALAVAGLLDRRLGGPGVFPYQPAGLWEELAYDPQQFTAQTYRQSHGADLYRRSLYTFWKRAAPPPALAAFDAPDREVCTVQRWVTTTPQQALILLNDPTFLEAARHLADRARQAAPHSVEDQIRRLFRTVLAREPDTGELRELLAAYRDERASFARDPAAAERLLAVGESPAPADAGPHAERAAALCVAHLVLCLDEGTRLP